MGQANRRKVEIAAFKARNDTWLSMLTLTERTIADVAIKAYEKIVIGLGMTEACYNLAFFLCEYMRRECDIELNIIVGWINDGTWNGATSHAWVTFEGKKIDISLHKTSHPDVQLSGEVIILDHIFHTGKVKYTYWSEMPDTAAKALAESSRDLTFARILAQKNQEHNALAALASSQEGVNEYFKHAPRGNSYDFLAQRIK